jgi:hypothetical protein
LDCPALGSITGNDTDNVRSHALQRESPSARNRTAIDETGEVMRRNKARNDVVFDLQQKVVWLDIDLTVRLFWKFISKNWKFSFEEQRTSNAVSISLWTTAHLTDKRP